MMLVSDIVRSFTSFHCGEHCVVALALFRLLIHHIDTLVEAFWS